MAHNELLVAFGMVVASFVGFRTTPEPTPTIAAPAAGRQDAKYCLRIEASTGTAWRGPMQDPRGVGRSRGRC